MEAQRSDFALYDDAPPPGMPAVDVDPFCAEFFADPFPAHELLREAGPVVWLSRYAIAASARFEEVRQVLSDWETFSSARGVGMADYERHGRFRLPSIVLEVDPPSHTRARGALSKALSPPVMAALRERFASVANDLVADLVARREFDGCKDLAEAFPLQVFPDAVGMRPGNRHNLLPYGDMVFNSFGPANEFFQASAPRAKAAFPWVEEESLRKNLSDDGFGMIVYRCADAGELSEDEAQKLVRSMLTAGVDTTVNGIGAALYCCARFPEQWAKLRSDPQKFARGAFEEAVRLESPVQTFFRTSVRPATVGGLPFDADRKILVFLGAANRDPRRWQDPDHFDIERKTVGHVGYGAGVHTCVGQLLARLEGEVVLQALARQVKQLELSGEPVRRFNNTLRGLHSLPLRIVPA